MAVVALSVNAADQIDIPGPPGSGSFGASVTVLPNGNIVVTDHDWNGGTGAVYLYSPTGSLISTLTGSSAGHLVGHGGVTALSNGNYVVRSPYWDIGPGAMDVGAVTWANGNTGISGVVSSANSLIGTNSNDRVGLGGVTALSNGNYVVISQRWDNGGITDVGAVTWANGSTGLSGVVSRANSLTGWQRYDSVGNGFVTALSNGNYVVHSWEWDNGFDAPDAGAITWANGNTGLSGEVSPANSLVGTTAGEAVGGDDRITELSNGNYVVRSPLWNNGGAVTWANGSTGLSGAISSANSLVGTASGTVTALSNGNYVVRTTNAVGNVGAVTWADGQTGLSGEITAANSLIGTTNNDFSGGGVTALNDGNYVVWSPSFDNGAATDVGAVTWADGSEGLSGVVSAANSLIGTTEYDRVGSNGVTALTNGNYVVVSPYWDIEQLGAVTWANGGTNRSGVVSAANSLIGTTSGDFLGLGGVTALSNGNYVIASSIWNNSDTQQVGAVTWANGTTELSGVVSPANSLVGTTQFDRVGSGVTALSNGNYVVGSHLWDNGAAEEAGAVTWADGSMGLAGVVSAANSLIGTTTNDRVGSTINSILYQSGVTPFRDGNYVVRSPIWDDGAIVDAGAVILGSGDVGVAGTILPENSVRGTVAGAGATMVFAYDPSREQLVVGRPASNIVSLFTLSTDLIFTNGFE